MRSAELPFVDEHVLAVDAPVSRVWDALLDVVDASFSGRAAEAYARLVGGQPMRASGDRPLATGSTLVGFEVADADPPRLLVLQGGHRFSTYSLAFHLEPLGVDRTRVHAETRATFPGIAGAMYRALVIGSRGHAILTRRLLARIAARSSAE